MWFRRSRVRIPSSTPARSPVRDSFLFLACIFFLFGRACAGHPFVRTAPVPVSLLFFMAFLFGGGRLPRGGVVRRRRGCVVHENTGRESGSLPPDCRLRRRKAAFMYEFLAKNRYLSRDVSQMLHRIVAGFPAAGLRCGRTAAPSFGGRSGIPSRYGLAEGGGPAARIAL